MLYERAVQAVDAETDFIDDAFHKLRRRRPARLREDFCGTGNTSAAWVRRRPANVAVGLDLDQPTLDWGAAHHARKLSAAQKRRLTLLNRNVLRPGSGAGDMDCVLAMNFSWWIFQERATLKQYFSSVRRSLVRDGVFFLDIYGGWETYKEQTERRPIQGGHRAKRGFTYIWEQAEFDPIHNRTKCHISFRLRDGSLMRRAFSYEWRVWSIPETRDVLLDAGFKRVTVYWEGDDGKGSGNGDFKPAQTGECCAAFIAYIAAEK
jgi:SAM-dependent methyltransferase